MQNATYSMPRISQNNVMDTDIIKTLEDNGWTVGTVQEFLSLTDKETRRVEEIVGQKNYRNIESDPE